MSTVKSDRTKVGPTPSRRRAPSPAEATPSSPLPGSPASLGYTPERGRLIVHWLAAFTLALAHAVSLGAVAMALSDPMLTLAWTMLPAWLTIALLPGARATGYHRWLVVLVLSVVVSNPVLGILTVTAGHTWILHRFWFVEYPRTSLLHSAFARVRSRRGSGARASRGGTERA